MADADRCAGEGGRGRGWRSPRYITPPPPQAERAPSPSRRPARRVSGLYREWRRDQRRRARAAQTRTASLGQEHPPRPPRTAASASLSKVRGAVCPRRASPASAPASQPQPPATQPPPTPPARGRRRRRRRRRRQRRRRRRRRRREEGGGGGRGRRLYVGIGSRLQIQFITRKLRSGGGRVAPARRGGGGWRLWALAAWRGSGVCGLLSGCAPLGGPPPPPRPLLPMGPPLISSRYRRRRRLVVDFEENS
uniref:Fragile X mental retardation syndrome-related protein 2-like n=1 Tax=Tursiops truncatus TaxID=9739 RepID=A0A6J3RA10_TURTR|nr:fragile X mental retardation syndrome-related protein 2-like [Tursiops truncatus]